MDLCYSLADSRLVSVSDASLFLCFCCFYSAISFIYISSDSTRLIADKHDLVSFFPAVWNEHRDSRPSHHKSYSCTDKLRLYNIKVLLSNLRL